MDDHVGKVCPHCNTPIAEGDTVTVCSACHTAHHAGCWDAHRGCSTAGCIHHYREPKPAPAPAPAVCGNCGVELSEGQAFCHKCGSPRNFVKKIFCTQCGAELQAGQGFCHKCGKPAGPAPAVSAAPAVGQFVPGAPPVSPPKKKTGLIIGIVAAVVALVLVVALLIPVVFVSVEDLCAQGRYAEAYEKAPEDEMDAVLAECYSAVISQMSIDQMKDPDSFVLYEAYYYPWVTEEGEVGQQVVLYISGNNGAGKRIENYWIWSYSRTEHEWICWGTTTTTTIYQDDDFEEMLKKVILESCLEHGIKLDDEQVHRINKLFDRDAWDEIDAIAYADIDSSRFRLDVPSDD